MNTKPFIITIIVANLCFIVLHIHKYNAIAELNNTNEQLRKELTQLQHQKGLLSQELALLQDTKTVMQFAQKQLHMRPVAQWQERKLPNTSAQNT